MRLEESGVHQSTEYHNERKMNHVVRLRLDRQTGGLGQLVQRHGHGDRLYDQRVTIVRAPSADLERTVLPGPVY